MLIRWPADIPSSEITPRSVYLRRRELMLGVAAVGLSALAPRLTHAAPLSAAKSPLSTNDPRTPLKDVTPYNNFYEFGTDKDDPAQHAHTLTTKPWTVKIDGLVDKPADYALDDLIKPAALEERIYRMRCVEGWSMVIPGSACLSPPSWPA
jgi:sulfoxide reductase catalytic subunit YedY